ncbi:hypothetical protein Igni_0727 [Ignicoccus hospitalis KIN4/I]|uniref:Uncharacterized protein n=2 Tax=Ignicoccus TaxID=54258 RepID=A8AAF7_IGNH4|nr:hypothetical protein Igni_0727 [Ignicoccus hospitalis KIN4/I]
MSYDHPRGRKGLLDEISIILREECVISVIANPYMEAAQKFSTMLSHIRDSSLIVRALRSSFFDCNSLFILFNAYNATVQFAEYVVKKLKSLGIGIIKTLVVDSALSLSALLPLLSEELVLTPWSTLGTIDPYIFVSHVMPKEAMAVKESIDQAIASVPKDGGGKGQVIYALAVSGSLYEYVLSEKHIRYLERLLNDYVRDRVAEPKFNELMNRMLNNIDVHDQPLSAKEINDLVNYSKIVEDRQLLNMIERYYNSAINYLNKSGKALLIETSLVTYDITPPNTNPLGY